MYSKFLIGLVLFLFNLYSSQNIIEGKIVSEYNEPVSYVNIGIINGDIGTISDKNGFFKIDIDNNQLEKYLTFYSSGYETQRFKISEIISKKMTIFTLQIKTKEIAEVIISPKNTKDVKLGTASYSTMVAGYVRVNNDKNRDIQEFAKEIKIKKPSRIKDININLFNVISSEKRSFRVNIYDIKNGLPNEKINTEDIIIDKKVESGWNTFDLSNFNLIYDKPIFISLEYIPQIVNEQEPFRYSGQLFGKSITRNASLGKWQVKKGITMSIYVTVAQ